MVELSPHPDGVILPVRAQPGGRQNALRGCQAGALKVSVTQAPEKGKATSAVADVLCQALALRSSQLELLSGATSRQKRFLVRGVSLDELQRRITTALSKV